MSEAKVVSYGTDQASVDQKRRGKRRKPASGEAKYAGIPKKWMGVQEVAEYLGVSHHSIYQYVQESRIPYHRIPGSHILRFLVAEIDDWILKEDRDGTEEKV
jgi:excisionase family DNA binding protein